MPSWGFVRVYVRTDSPRATRTEQQEHQGKSMENTDGTADNRYGVYQPGRRTWGQKSPRPTAILHEIEKDSKGKSKPASEKLERTNHDVSALTVSVMRTANLEGHSMQRGRADGRGFRRTGEFFFCSRRAEACRPKVPFVRSEIERLAF